MKIVMLYNIQIANCGLTCAVKEMLCKKRSKSEASQCTNCAARKMATDVNSVLEDDQGKLLMSNGVLLSDQCNFRRRSSLPMIFSVLCTYCSCPYIAIYFPCPADMFYTHSYDSGQYTIHLR